MPNQDNMLDTIKVKRMVHAIDKENYLRLKWFRKNEKRLEEIVNTPNSRTVPQQLKNDVREARQNQYRNARKSAVKDKFEDQPMTYDERALTHVMRPVDPEVTKLLYSGTQKDGRINYLTIRNRIIPEEKYYCAETTNFGYGWKMWDHAKSRVNLGNGRQQIVKNSFYRRRGVECDPEWYKEPATRCPKLCG